jgi:hypothetical protein
MYASSSSPPELIKDKQTFPNLDFVGWFTTAQLSESTLYMHNLFTSLTPLPILIVLDPSGLSASGSDALPITIYESIPAVGTVEVGEVEFRLETGEAERIGVEHVSTSQGKIGEEQSDADERKPRGFKGEGNASGERVDYASECNTVITESY